MRIVQWNTHHGGANGGMVPKVGDVLATLMPDVVCLNEVQQRDGYGHLDQIDTYRQRLGMVAAVGAHSNGKLVTASSSGQCNAIVSRWPITEVAVLGLPNGRAAIAGVTNGVTIVSTHLTNDEKGKSFADVRAAQVKALRAWPVMEASPIVVCGDWNAAPGAVEIAPMVGAYEDAWLVARAMGKGTAFNATGNTKNSRIDAVFTKGLDLQTVDVPDTRVNGVFPSDHHPIVVDFTDPMVTQPDDQDAVTAKDAAQMLLCAAFSGLKNQIDVWTLLALTTHVPIAQIQEAGTISTVLDAWCQKYGPWDVTRRTRTT